RAKVDALNEKSQAMGQAVYAAEQSSAASGAGASAGSSDGETGQSGASGQAGADEDVVDAEVIDDDQEAK
ncbi:MAG: molecular chaperone DnaK, partial [Intrasporangium sp.]